MIRLIQMHELKTRKTISPGTIIGAIFLCVIMITLSGCSSTGGKGKLMVINETNDDLNVTYDGPVFGYFDVGPGATESVELRSGKYRVQASKAHQKEKWSIHTAIIHGGSGVQIRYSDKRK